MTVADFRGLNACTPFLPGAVTVDPFRKESYDADVRKKYYVG